MQVDIVWPCDMAVTEAGSELSMVAFLKAEIMPNTEPFTQLPERERELVETRALELKMHPYQAAALRRQLLQIKYGVNHYHAQQNRVKQGEFAGSQAALARLFELTVQAFLDVLCVKYETEHDQRNGGVRSGPTPDFLLKAPMRINDAAVYWIECKSGYASQLFAKSKCTLGTKLDETVRKYAARYGPGAVVFTQGFHAGRKVDGCILLDNSALNMAAYNDMQAKIRAEAK